jgi:hypothetical protein
MSFFFSSVKTTPSYKQKRRPTKQDKTSKQQECERETKVSGTNEIFLIQPNQKKLQKAFFASATQSLANLNTRTHLNAILYQHS